MTEPDHPPLTLEVIRSGVPESRHLGIGVAIDPAGRTVWSAGDPGAVILPRSALKPLQAVGLLEGGLELDPPLLALAAASHDGSARHVDEVRRLLAGHDVPESALANTPALPLDLTEYLDAGGRPDRLHQNCSGKHAAMLAACRRAGWPLDGYLDPAHPVQRAVRAAIERLTGHPVAAVAVDGCGAPQFGVPMAALATGYARLVTAPPGSAEGRVAAAMRAHPDLVGGPARSVTLLMRGVPGLLAKDGADGVYAAAGADGAAVVVKVLDGGERARTPLLVAGLRALGMAAPVLDELAVTPVLGGGRPVGEVRVAAPAP